MKDKLLSKAKEECLSNENCETCNMTSNKDVSGCLLAGFPCTWDIDDDEEEDDEWEVNNV